MARGAYLKNHENTIAQDVAMSSNSDFRAKLRDLPALPPLGQQTVIPKSTSVSQRDGQDMIESEQTPVPSWRRVTCYIDPKLLDSIERVSFSIRSPTGARLNRSQAIRAILRAVMNGDIDTSGVQTEEELEQLILRRIRGYQ